MVLSYTCLTSRPVSLQSRKRQLYCVLQKGHAKVLLCQFTFSHSLGASVPITCMWFNSEYVLAKASPGDHGGLANINLYRQGFVLFLEVKLTIKSCYWIELIYLFFVCFMTLYSHFHFGMGLKSCLPSHCRPAECREDCSCLPYC